MGCLLRRSGVDEGRIEEKGGGLSVFMLLLVLVDMFEIARQECFVVKK